jgi:hypothetical protein
LRSSQIFGLGFFGIAGVLLIVAAAMAVSTADLLSKARRTEGTVIDQERVKNAAPLTARDAGILYYPRIEFQHPQEGQVTFTGRAGTNPPAYEEGETVDVLYVADNPRIHMIASFWEIWGRSLIVGGTGAGFALVGLVYFAGFGAIKDQRRDADEQGR